MPEVCGSGRGVSCAAYLRRAGLVSQRTLDGRTYPESAAETAAELTNATHVLIENAGHNLFMVALEVTKVTLAFMRGEDPEPRPIRVPVPRFPY